MAFRSSHRILDSCFSSAVSYKSAEFAATECLIAPLCNTEQKRGCCGQPLVGHRARKRVLTVDMCTKPKREKDGRNGTVVVVLRAPPNARVSLFTSLGPLPNTLEYNKKHTHAHITQESVFYRTSARRTQYVNGAPVSEAFEPKKKVRDLHYRYLKKRAARTRGTRPM